MCTMHQGVVRACAAVDCGVGVRSRGLWHRDVRGCVGERDVMDEGAQACEAMDEGSGMHKRSWDIAEGAGEALMRAGAWSGCARACAAVDGQGRGHEHGMGICGHAQVCTGMQSYVLGRFG